MTDLAEIIAVYDAAPGRICEWIVAVLAGEEMGI